MRGLTSEAIHRQFGLALGGALAPRDATGVARSNALATPSPLPGEASDKPTSSPVENYPLQTQHFAPPEDDGPSRWAISPPEQGGRGAIAYLGANPVKFMPRRGLLPFEIHPEDVSYGYLLAGVMLERVDERLTNRTVEREFHELKIDPDGFVRLAFQAPNMAGTELAFEVALRVTPSAVRRGPNVTFWSQRQFCGACGRDRLREDAERFYETGELAPLPRLVDACQRWESSAIVLDRPFQRETGHAYLARLPEVREIADTMETPHRSPFYLCEDDHIFGVAHAPHDSIRDLGGANFSHWYEHLYFSSADGSDPNTNGRNYFLVRPPIEEEDARPTGVFDG